MSTGSKSRGVGRPSHKAILAQRPDNLVQPAQYDRMRAPIWTQSLSAPARAGADDHKRHASRGF